MARECSDVIGCDFVNAMPDYARVWYSHSLASTHWYNHPSESVIAFMIVNIIARIEVAVMHDVTSICGEKCYVRYDAVYYLFM
jgi:hypothetical protein